MKRILDALVACIVSMLMAPAHANAEPTTQHLTIEGKRVLQVQAEIAAKPEEVWSIWTTPESFRSVFDRKLTIDLRPGGPYEIEWAPDAPEGERGSETCKVLTVDPYRVFSFEWNAPPTIPEVRNGRKHWIVLTFEPSPHGTILTLRALGYGEGDAWDQTYDYFKEAWPWVVGQVQQHFAKPADPEAAARDAQSRDAWVYLIQPTRNDFIETMTDAERTTIGEHFQYLLKLTQQGQVILAGPCTDMKAPGIVVFQAADETAARHIMESDPAVAAGVFGAELHPMRLSLLRERDRTDQ
ncbi:MAG: SRPBCC domain-containing protein [Phycisphaerales bacterium]|nr:SRPBCC domain-containing protein [Phycisphaerales bacterium]